MALGARLLIAVTRSKGALPRIAEDLLLSRRDICPSISSKGYLTYIECTSHLSSSYTARPSLHSSHPHHPYHCLKTLHHTSWAPHSPTLLTRSLHSSTIWFHDTKPSGVQPPETKPPPPPSPLEALDHPPEQEKAAVVKQSLYRRVVDELKFYYRGFRLLAIDTRVAGAMVWQLLQGEALTRREWRRLMRTCVDLFRLVPFVPFLIFPFAELLLPVFLKLFPNMLPSTFRSKSEKERKQIVKEKLGQFLQETLSKMPGRNGNGHHGGTGEARRFSSLIQSARDKGEQPATGDIVSFSKHFEEEMTLERLERPQLVALCRLLEVQPIWSTNNLLRWLLRVKLDSIRKDDKEIVADGGVAKMDTAGLQEACHDRGMRSLGLSAEQLREQLQQWLDLHLNENMPPSLMLLSRIMYLTERKPKVPVIPPVPKLKNCHSEASSMPPSAEVLADPAPVIKDGAAEEQMRDKAPSLSDNKPLSPAEVLVAKDATDAAQKCKTNSNGV